jgi:hypothetical protein
MTVDTNTATATTSGGSNSNQPVSYFDFRIKQKNNFLKKFCKSKDTKKS